MRGWCGYTSGMPTCCGCRSCRRLRPSTCPTPCSGTWWLAGAEIAMKALDAEDYAAQVDGYLEVRVDARLAVLTKPEGETDESEGEN